MEREKVPAEMEATCITVKIEVMSAKEIGIDGLKSKGGETQKDFRNVIKKVTRQCSDFGAVQNRLEHTLNNLDNVVEITTSAESRIRDTDMAAEMV